MGQKVTGSFNMQHITNAEMAALVATAIEGDEYYNTDIKDCVVFDGVAFKSGGGGVNYANTIIVAKTGGDYDTIQAAIDASVSGDAIVIHPGTYTENITTKAGGTTNLEGIGNMGSVIIEANTGNVLTVPSTMMSMAFLKNLKLKSTVTGNNQSKLVYSDGMMVSYLDVVFDYNLTNGYTEKIIDLQVGSSIFMNCKFDYDGVGTSGGSTNFISASGAARFNILQGFGDITTASVAPTDHIHFIEYNSIGLSIIRDFDSKITASSASYGGHLDFVHHIKGEVSVMSSTILISTPSGIAGSYGQIYHMAGTAGSHIHSTSNRIEVLGFEKNYIGNLGATESLYSHFDDITAVDNIIGDGTYSYVNSPSNGNLQMSGNLIKKLIEVTADYDETESWEFGVMDATPSTADITATVNTTMFSNAKTGATKTFMNSGTEHNLIFDPNGGIVGGSTQARAIYPGGYLIVEKLGDEAIVVASHNTSFNILLDDIANKSFHIDFSDASSITTSGDNITNVVESINSWNGTSTLAGDVKYGLTTQNGLNTALWDSANSTINFGDRDIHSNAAGRGLTIIAVIKPTHSGDAIISKYADNTPNREWRFLTNSAVIYEELDGSGNEASLNYSSNYTEWEVLEISRVPGERMYAYKNGYLLGSSSYVTNDIPAGTSELMVGISDITGMDYYGEMGEILAISDTITSDERAALTSKLGAKRGIDVAVFSSSDSSPFGRDDETDTIRPLIDGDSLDMGAGKVKGTIITTSDITTNRPGTPTIGQQYFDTTLGYAIWYDGTNWVDATGTTV